MRSQDLSGRSSGRMTSHPSNSQVGDHSHLHSRDDGLPLKPHPMRVRPARAESVIANFSPLEQSIVTDVGRLRLMTGGQLARLHFEPSLSGKRQARRVLEALSAQRVLTRLGRRVGGKQAGSSGFLYALDTIGQRFVDPLAPLRRPWLPSASFIAHSVMVSECYVILREAERRGELELLDFDAEPACWRPFVDGRGARKTLKPDAFVRIGIGDFLDSWFLECDRSTEDLPRIRRKAAAFGQYFRTGKEDVFPRVLWVANRVERAAGLVRVLTDLPDDERQLFGVCTINDFREAIAGGAGGQP